MRGRVALVLLLAGCGESGSSPDACTSELGMLRVCIYEDASSTMTISGSATVRRDASDVPWIMPTQDDGCTHERLEAGTWEVNGFDSTGTCSSGFMPIEIRACEVTEVRAEVLAGCVDG
jgi:hypothetical protein